MTALENQAARRSATTPLSRHVAVALTGASGACYGIELVRQLLAADCRVSLLASRAGRQVVELETGQVWPAEVASWQDAMQAYFATSASRLRCYGADDFCAPVASGSAAADALVVVPASMGCLGRLAVGISSNLIERAADVMLKENRPLLLVPRETPLSRIHLANLLRLAEAGAVIVPAMPAFYTQPRSIDDLIHFVVGKLLDQLGIAHQLFVRWGAAAPSGDNGDSGSCSYVDCD